MIGQHPQAYGLPEMNLFIVNQLKDFWGINTSRFGFSDNRRHGLLRTIAELYGGEQTTETIDMARHWCAARENSSGGEVFRELVSRLDPLMAVDKSPVYSLDLNYLYRIRDTFPDARFLHLIRHPVNQGNSVMKLYDGAFAVIAHSIDYSEETAVLDPQLAWHDINANILDFLDSVQEEKQMRICGENIMQEPQAQLKKICQWLGLRDDDAAVEAMLHPENSPYACIGPVNAMYGNDPNFLHGPKFRQHKPARPELDADLWWREDNQALYPEVRELARELGY
jgi:hypothetical protein